MTLGGESDESSQWWAAVLGVAAYWLLGEDSRAEQLCSRVEAMPEQLARAGDPLPRAVLAALRARRALLSRPRRASTKAILRQCSAAGRLLDHSITYSACKQPSIMVLVSDISCQCEAWR